MPASERDEDDEVVPPAEPPEPPGPTRGSGLVLATSLAVVLAVATAVLAVLLVRSGDGSDDDLRATAGRFGEALVTYDFHDPEAHRDSILALSTGSFREQYERAFAEGLGQLITEVEATSVGYVKDVYLSSVDEDEVQAIVVADIEHDGAGGQNRLYDVYFRLTLVRVDGDWLIDDVTDLNFGAGGGGAPTTTSTTPDPTSTSVP